MDYYLSMNLKETKGSVLIELEDPKGKIRRIEKNFSKGTTTKRKIRTYKNKDDALNQITEQKYKRYIMKLRIKDELAYGAFMVMHPLLGEKEAKSLKMKADYIVHVVGKVNKKIVFDFNTSARLRVDPFFRFTFNAPKKSGKLEIVVTDNRGKTQSFYKAYKI